MALIASSSSTIMLISTGLQRKSSSGRHSIPVKSVYVCAHPILFVALMVNFSLSILKTRCHRVLCLNLPCQNLWIVCAAVASLVVVVVGGRLCMYRIVARRGALSYLFPGKSNEFKRICVVERDFSWVLNSFKILNFFNQQQWTISRAR